jgi:hypothetical protein
MARLEETLLLGCNRLLIAGRPATSSSSSEADSRRSASQRSTARESVGGPVLCVASAATAKSARAVGTQAAERERATTGSR